MKKFFYGLSLFISICILFNCSENDNNKASFNKEQTNYQNTSNKIGTNHLKVEIDENKYDFYYDKNNIEIYLTTTKGKSGFIFNYNQDINLVSNVNTNSLSASYGSDFNMDLRNISFNDNVVTFDEYRNNTFYENKSITVSEKIKRTDFFNSLDSTLLLENSSILNQMHQKACPPCVGLLIIVAATVISDSNEGNQDLCAQQNALVAANCANREGYCLESNGPCKLKCLPCPLTNP